MRFNVFIQVQMDIQKWIVEYVYILFYVSDFMCLFYSKLVVEYVLYFYI